MADVETPARKKSLNWLYDVLFILVLLMGAYFRFKGSNWGELNAQHPDENFMTGVIYSIKPVANLSEYFNTGASTLNPANVGQGAYVYGTLPLFGVRFLGDALKMTDLKLFGRQMAALMDLGSIVILYFLVKRLYKQRVALLAAAFSAMAVMQIQQSHFFTTDSFVTFFIVLTLYFAVLIATGRREDRQKAVAPFPEAESPAPEKKPTFEQRASRHISDLIRNPLTYLTVAFGLALGMAAASKINGVVLAIMLPVALFVRYFSTQPEDGMKKDWWGKLEEFLARNFIFMVLGALVSFLTFRILQPYAFAGPGFFGIKLNPFWIQRMRDQLAQTSPNSDLPWDLQWARRTHLYSWQNLTKWGLGLPLGLLAWAGFLWMAWRMIRGEWRQHLVLWFWTAGYFTWQSLQYNATMRYELPIYSTLAMMAAWLVIWLWDKGRQMHTRRGSVLKTASITVGALVFLLTLGWAYAFSNIYVNPEPRIAASNWAFQNIPGPINLQIQTPAGTTYQQPLPLQPLNISLPPYNYFLHSGTPFETVFTAQQDGSVEKILLPYVTGQALRLTLAPDQANPQALANATLLSIPAGDEAVASQQLILDQQPTLAMGQAYTLSVQALDPSLQMDLCGPIQMTIMGSTSPAVQIVDPGPNCTLGPGQILQIPFSPDVSGALANIFFEHVADIGAAGPQSLTASLSSGDPSLASNASASSSFTPTTDPRGEPVTLALDKPFQVKKGASYALHLDTTSEGLFLSGATVANETDFDYSLPFRVGNYDPFPYIYPGGVNLQVYWDDNPNKLERFETTLNQSDYILIPTNHQYAQITRIPERHPLTTEYYRDLIGCPAEKTIIWCYENGEPGMFHGKLGFELAATFEDFPTIGPLRINDSTAEEAFTFYDHPKVLVFKKTAEYDPANVAARLGAVDTSLAIHLTPGQADHYKSTLLPANGLASQQAGGTWADLFNQNALYNRYPGLGLLLWYVVILLLGLFTYPLVRAALPGLDDHGYPLARVVGLLLWAWFAWMAGSIGLTYSRLSIGVSLVLLIGLGLWFAWRQREELAREFRQHWKYFLLVEGLFLAFFLVDLLIRIGNPDLWHPSKGGERPMEFTYFNAILKSTSFPPYDAWFAGGYINYYYYGYVIVGTPVKLLGIVPTIAFNFILPTLFACVGMAAFSVGWNLLAGLRTHEALVPEEPNAAEDEAGTVLEKPKPSLFDARFIGGLSAGAAIILLGNLGIVRMLYQGFQKVAAPGGVIDKANIFTRIAWTVKGFFMTLVAGAHLPYGAGDWYWIPSRALPASSGDPITEFPIFSFIFSDLHAHVIALMITILAIAWALSVLLSRARWKNPLNAALGFFLGALIVGVIKPTNTWDYYTYMLLCSIVLAYSVWRYAGISRLHVDLPEWVKRLGLTAGAVLVLVGGSMLLYQPYTHWYLLDPGYTKVYPWTGGRSDIGSYLIHWGVFLFFIFSWMVWETRQWLAETPISAVRKLRPFRDLIVGAAAILLLILVIQQWWVMRSNQTPPWKGVTIVWIALPLAVWAGVLLLFSPRLSDVKRLIMFMVGTGLLLTIVVEFFVMGGDIGRMNMVFKLYYQAWTLLGLSAAACFVWLLAELGKWLSGWRLTWEVAATLLIAGASMFIVMGGMGKVEDRMSATAPHTLDSLTYMNYSTYYERNTNLDLSYDYRAIRWLQENVKGSPVIAEAPGSGIQYEWFNRFSIYTGLPDVIGWQWHQQQQRVLFSNIVITRANEENNFYTTDDINQALAFIQKYNVRYIIVGQLEQAVYVVGTGFAVEPQGCPNCLDKFTQYDGKYWHSVYRDGPVTIYEVNP